MSTMEATVEDLWWAFNQNHRADALKVVKHKMVDFYKETQEYSLFFDNIYQLRQLRGMV